MKKYYTLPAFALLLPTFVAHAAVGGGLQEIITLVGGILGSLIGIFITIALLYFIWGLVVFIKDSGNVEKNVEGRNKMIWGIVALFVIVSVWGLVRFIGKTIGVNPEENRTITVPQLPTN